MKNESSQAEPKSRKVLITSLGILVLLTLVCFLYFLVIRPGKDEKVIAGFGGPSIAVIPVSNSMCDPELEYLSANMHDAVVNELGNINSLLVKSKSATMKYLESDLPLQQIATELGANEIVKTSLVCGEKGTQLLVQLIQVYPEEKEIWRHTYDQDWENIFTIYRDITHQITKKMKIDLTPRERARLNTERPVKPEFYKAYAQGVFYLNKLTPEGFTQGLKYMNQAIAIDPADPLTYLALALGYSNAGHASAAAEEAPELAKKYALHALELDSTLAEAYTVLATSYLYEDWDWAKTEDALKRSIKLNPNISSLHYTLGWYLCLTRQLREAEEEFKLAIKIDPLDPICTGYLSWFYLYTGHHKEAISMALKTLELDPNYTMAYYVSGSAYAEMGMFEKAIETHKKGIAISPDYIYGLGVAYARAGMRNEALAVATEIEKENNVWFIIGLADIYAVLGDKDKALQWLQVAYEQHIDFFPWIESMPYYSTLQNDLRFQKLSAVLDLPEQYPYSRLVSVD
jgi:tetratricopeptide (TPR) repeat protein